MKIKLFVLVFSLLILTTLFGKQPILTVDPQKEPFVPDSGDAIKFYSPDSTTYQVLDVGVQECMSPNSEGIFIFPNLGFVPWATIRNYGDVNAGTFDVSCLIMDTAGMPTIWVDTTITVSGLSVGSDTTLYFSDPGGVFLWFVDNYFALVQTTLPGDTFYANDTLDCELKVVCPPQWLVYDSNSSFFHHPWFLPEGWAQKFVPPCYPAEINSVAIAITSDSTVNVPILFMDDDGPNGSPGTILHSDTVYVPGGPFWDWYTISISPPACIIYPPHAFYVGIVVPGNTYLEVISEQVGPFSRRGWEYEGYWTPYSERYYSELFIRAYHYVPGIAEKNGKTDRSYSLTLLPVSPNPLKGNTRIHYSLPSESDVTLKVYNILGQEVRTLVDSHQKPGLHSVIFDAKDSGGNALPQGVYFYRLKVGNNSLTRKIALIR